MERYTDAQLDAARRRTDPLADDAARALLSIRADKRLSELVAELESLSNNSQALPDDLPPEVARFFQETIELPERYSHIGGGQRFFEEHGLAIFVVLNCYSLPASYAAKNGVQVLAATDRLEGMTNRRVFETGQMLIDVLTEGGLAPTGSGLRTLQKVRLMHAAIRHLIKNREGAAWDVATLGEPINQEDLAGTLMTFSWIVLDGLEKMGLVFSDQEAQDYLEIWRAVGFLLGIEEALIPADLAQAKELTQIIRRRQVGPSDMGKRQTAALLTMMRENIQGEVADELPAAMMRFFLGDAVADQLGVPRRPVEQALYTVASRVFSRLEDIWDETELARTAQRGISRALMRSIVRANLQQGRHNFRLPTHLQAAMTPTQPLEPSWRDRLIEFVKGLFR